MTMTLTAETPGRAFQRSHVPSPAQEYERGIEIDPATYLGEIGESGDPDAEVTWETNETTGARVCVFWRRFF